MTDDVGKIIGISGFWLVLGWVYLILSMFVVQMGSEMVGVPVADFGFASSVITLLAFYMLAKDTKKK